jgi:uncharacterized protein
MDAHGSDLVFNVAQLLKEHVGATRKLDLNTSTLQLEDQSSGAAGDGVLKAQHLNGNAKVTRISEGLLVQGNVEANVDLECSRCLTNFAVPVEARLEEQFQPTIDVMTGTPVQRLEGQDNDATFDIDHNHMMDLSEPVRQAILVSLPMKPLCREDCAGLCPNCGANQNEGPHQCEVETADNRWAGLRELRLEDFPAGDNSQN